MSRQDVPRKTNISSQCDGSGICELADEVASGEIGVDRLVEVCVESMTIVDIAPIAVGHLLVVPFKHRLQVAQLGLKGFAELWTYVGESSSHLKSLGLGQVAAVEHGSPSVRNAMSCVRHCHTHVCPVSDRFRTVEDLLPVVKEYSEIVAVCASARQTYDVVSRLDEYLLVRLGDVAMVGRPRPGIRQISRALLADVNDRYNIREVDWVLEAENQHYFDTIKILNE